MVLIRSFLTLTSFVIILAKLEIKVDNLEIISDPKWKTVNYNLTKVATGYEFNAIVKIMQKIMSINLKVTLTQYDNKTKSFSTLFDRVVDVCRNMEKDRTSDFLSKSLKKMISRSYDMPNACPVQPGVYIVKKINIQEDLLPSFLSVSNMNLTLKGVSCTNIKIKGRIKEEICFSQLTLRLQVINT